MTVPEILLLSVALAMDCMSVSVTCGIIQKRMGGQVWAMAFLFGFFQAMMPLIGWLAGSAFSRQIEAYDHWVVFGLLLLIGGKMIWDGFSGDKALPKFNPSSAVVLLTLSVATSIDAMAVGFTFVGMGIRTFASLLFPLLSIGLCSLVLSLFGKYIGVKLGRAFDWPAEQLGGVILIFIGLKVLLQHLSA